MWATEAERREAWMTEVVGICPECGCKTGECYLICPRHPDYEDGWAEAEREYREERDFDPVAYRAYDEYERFYEPPDPERERRF